MVIICGNNKRIYTVLQKQFQNNPRVHILGYTNRVADYMDACDVIFTKPGGLTSTEALVKRIPIVHTAPIPGCETANRNFFVKKTSFRLLKIHCQTDHTWKKTAL